MVTIRSVACLSQARVVDDELRPPVRSLNESSREAIPATSDFNLGIPPTALPKFAFYVCLRDGRSNVRPTAMGRLREFGTLNSSH